MLASKQTGFHTSTFPASVEVLSSATAFCGLACIETSTCFSFNLAAFADVNGHLHCELLPSDKYNNSDKLVPSTFFHHFSIAVSGIVWTFFFFSTRKLLSVKLFSKVI